MMKLCQPIFFKPNRVRRIYTGGRLFSDFFGDASEDGFYPEEWVASSTRALNLGSTDPYEGISMTEDGEYLSDLLESNKKELLGERSEMGVLVKMLDSAIRLPVQTHPDIPFSQKYFNSNHGKAESWVVLATREGACIYLGFKEKVSVEVFRDALNGGEEKLLPLLNRIPVKPGDVFFIPARAVHAIGPGCLILETQEPTDFTIQPEATCAGYALTDYEKYLGLDPDLAFTCFDMDFLTETAETRCRKTPIAKNGKEELITKADTPCFAVNRYTVEKGRAASLTPCAVYVVTEGEGRITGKDYSRKVKKGGYFFLPASAEGFLAESDGKMALVECLPPEN